MQAVRLDQSTFDNRKQRVLYLLDVVEGQIAAIQKCAQEINALVPDVVERGPDDR